MEHIYRSEILTNSQHGFVNGRSCMTQMLECLDDWTRILDNDGSVDVIYIDYAKAFDKVAHKRLLIKLEGYGISPQLIQWIGSFLSGRRQKVRVNGAESEWEDVLSGVPQGSVLGPVLFILFVNDLPEMIKTKVKMYADDTKIYADVSNEENYYKLQEDIDSLDKWAHEWQLSFNTSKCKVMHIGKKNPRKTYTMNQNNCKTEIEET